MAKQDETLDFVRSQSLELAIDGADIVVVFTEWDEIAEASPQLFAERMRGNTIVDTRYLYSKDQFQKFNLNVISVGKN
jgi:UDPglucose 6-dehydrogenase